jgi:hypothetical protein
VALSDADGTGAAACGGTGGLSQKKIFSSSVTVQAPANQAPVLNTVGDKSSAEETELAFTATATDEDVASLQFSLANPATGTFPTGAAITAGGAFTWTPTEAQGPGTYRVKVVVTDNGSLTDEEEIAITVTEVNKAPELAAIGNKSVNEGSLLSFTATATDPDLPANTLTFSLQGAPAGASINASTGVFTWTPDDDDPTGTPSDANTFKVVVTDNGTPQLSDEETITVTVNNIAPVVDAGADQSGTEGQTINLSGSFNDPGADSHTWTWEYVEGFNAGATCNITNPTTSLTPTITCNDDGTVRVTLTVRDDDTGQGQDEMLLTLSNVAPTASGLNTNSPVNEGSDIVLSLANATDASSIDAASLHYAFDCGSGYSATDYAGASAINSANCPTDDNGTRVVKGKVFDKDGGVSSEHSATVTINNVAPTAMFNAPSPVNEGSNIALSLTNADDVSSVDKLAGFTYAFDCGDGAGYGAFDATASKNCLTTDNGTRTVKGKIQDKDGGVSEYTSTVQVNNVAPTITSWTPLNDPVVFGSTVNFSASFTDPGTADTHTGEYDCGTGAYSIPTSTTSPFGYSCTFSSIGPKTIKVKVRDDDGGYAERLFNFTVVYTFSGFFAPVDRPNMMNVSKAGQAIPLKWRLTDAAGNGVAGVTGVTIQSYNVGCSAGSGTDLIEEYAAGLSGLQDLGDGYYQFNWKTPGSYANTCKSIALAFGTGGLGYTTTPAAFFTFKK